MSHCTLKGKKKYEEAQGLIFILALWGDAHLARHAAVITIFSKQQT